MYPRDPTNAFAWPNSAAMGLKHTNIAHLLVPDYVGKRCKYKLVTGCLESFFQPIKIPQKAGASWLDLSDSAGK